MAPVIFAGSDGSGVSVPRINFVAIAILLGAAATGAYVWQATGSPLAPAAILALGLVLMQAPRVAQQWERAVVLRLGRFIGLRGPGLFWVVPFVDRVTSWIDQRTITTSFAAEQTLTLDPAKTSRPKRCARNSSSCWLTSMTGAPSRRPGGCSTKTSRSRSTST